MMKNIHVIQTHNPSRLVIDTIENKLYLQPILHEKTINVLTQNIYITNSEKPKAGEWSLYENKIHKCIEDIIGDEFKKIILTTNQDLIADGVQAINDEFLEWFVKNPSCEKVGVINTFDYNKKHFVEHSGYKIIIPKEEPKQEMSARLQNSLTQFNLYIEEALELEDWKLKTIGFSNKSIIELRNLTPKQETLEEVSKRIFNIPEEKKGDVYFSRDIAHLRKGFKLGAKWQQEQIYNQIKELYDNENITGFTKRAYAICLDIVEQFKNK
jgi:hypothetical protein